jgi:polar amino acid transport system permease protein
VSDDASHAPDGRYPVRRLALLCGAVLFWGWLLVRWFNDWVLVRVGAGVPRGEPLPPLAWLESSGVLGGALEPIGFALSLLPTFASGIWLTVVLTVGGMVLGFLIAVPLSVARVYGRWSSRVALVYTELIRGTPLLAQLFVLYYGLGLSSWIRELPYIGYGPIPGQAVWVAIIGFTINSAAYQGEYIRAALQSVEAGQLTAARSIGLSKLEGIRYVVLPQGLRYAIPGWTNELVYLIKYSSLAAFITVPELFRRAQSIASSNFRYTAVFITVGAIYLCLVLSASSAMNYVERRVAIPGLGQIEDRQ